MGAESRQVAVRVAFQLACEQIEHVRVGDLLFEVVEVVFQQFVVIFQGALPALDALARQSRAKTDPYPFMSAGIVQLIQMIS